jgi:hypothetical protein
MELKKQIGKARVCAFVLGGLMLPLSEGAAMEQSYWVYDGTSLNIVHRDPSGVVAAEWAAFYFRKSAPAGTMSQRWGVDTRDSAEGAVRAMQANQKFERQYEKWCECSWGQDTFFNAIAPVAISRPATPHLNTRQAELLSKAHGVWDRMNLYRERFNSAATLADEQKLPKLYSGPLAEFMKNMHDTLDKYLSIREQVTHYSDAASLGLDRSFDSFFDSVGRLDGSAEPAFRQISNGDRGGSGGGTIDPRMVGRYHPLAYGLPLELRRNGDQITLVLYDNYGKALQSFSGKAVMDDRGQLTVPSMKPTSAGDYSGCSIDYVNAEDGRMSFGCVMAKDPTSGTGWTAIRDQ